MSVAEIREFVQRACQAEANIFGPAFFRQHVGVVAECCAQLAKCLRADAEVVELAAHLHDLSAVCDPATLPNHAQASAEMAVQILSERGYSSAGVAAVARAIASHSEPLAPGISSPEEVCLSNADAAARIIRPAYWLYFAFVVRKQGFAEGRQWLRLLFERQWGMLVEPARELIGARYAATIELLSH